jgi:hypothetical protein
MTFTRCSTGGFGRSSVWWYLFIKVSSFIWEQWCYYRCNRCLLYLQKTKPCIRKHIITKADSSLVDCLCECADNILRGNGPLAKLQKEKLKRNKAGLSWETMLFNQSLMQERQETGCNILYLTRHTLSVLHRERWRFLISEYPACFFSYISIMYIVQNLFHHRTISLNAHYMVIFQNLTDVSQIMALAHQM